MTNKSSSSKLLELVEVEFEFWITNKILYKAQAKL